MRITSDWHAASAALSAAETWLRNRQGGRLEDFVLDIEPVQKKGESLPDAIARHRGRVEELKAALQTTRNAPLDANTRKARARASIEDLAMRGAIRIERDGAVVLPSVTLQSSLANVALAQGARGAIAFTESVDAGPLLAYLHKGALIEAASAIIDSESSDQAMTDQARWQTETELMAELLDVERAESQAVWTAQSQGMSVEHRPDVSVVALLGIVTLVEPPRIPGSSPERAGYNLVGGRR